MRLTQSKFKLSFQIKRFIKIVEGEAAKNE